MYSAIQFYFLILFLGLESPTWREQTTIDGERLRSDLIRSPDQSQQCQKRRRIVLNLDSMNNLCKHTTHTVFSLTYLLRCHPSQTKAVLSDG